MPGTKIELGPVGFALAENIRTLRLAQRLTYAELVRRIEGLGRNIPSLSLRRIEDHSRRVDVDDLDAIAAALQVPREKLLDGGVVTWGDHTCGGKVVLRRPERQTGRDGV